MRDHYYRVVYLGYEVFDKMLNLPPGFKVDAVQDDPMRRAYAIRVACPDKKQFQVAPGDTLRAITGVVSVNEYGVVTKLEWPDLV